MGFLLLDHGSVSSHAHKFIKRVEIVNECSHAWKLEGMEISMPIEALGIYIYI